jgi:hypothetical protein
MFYPFCILGPRKSHRVRQNWQKNHGGAQEALWKAGRDPLIVDSLRHDLREELKYKKGAGAPRRISVEELHARVMSVEWQFRKDFRTLAQKIGVPTTTLLMMGARRACISYIRFFSYKKSRTKFRQR